MDPISLVAKLDRQRDQLARLAATFPWRCDTEEDQRAALTYMRAERRYLETYARDALMTIIPGLEELDELLAKQPEKLTNFAPQPKGSIRELGLALKTLDDFCAEVAIPLIARLERGLDKMEALPMTREGDEEHERLLAYWRERREELRGMLQVAWRFAIVARQEFASLDKAEQDKAVAIWGPLKGDNALDYAPTLHRSWPKERVRALDDRAIAEGDIDLANPFPANPRPTPIYPRRRRKA
jgi:hypothetical protein